MVRCKGCPCQNFCIRKYTPTELPRCDFDRTFDTWEAVRMIGWDLQWQDRLYFFLLSLRICAWVVTSIISLSSVVPISAYGAWQQGQMRSVAGISCSSTTTGKWEYFLLQGDFCPYCWPRLRSDLSFSRKSLLNFCRSLFWANNWRSLNFTLAFLVSFWADQPLAYDSYWADG